MTVNCVSYVDRYLRSTVYGLFELLIQKCLYKNIVNGLTDLTNNIYRKSTFLPCLRTGLSIYFCAIFGPVYIFLTMVDRLSVMIISIDLAILGGLSIHKLSYPFYALLL